MANGGSLANLSGGHFAENFAANTLHMSLPGFDTPAGFTL